MRKMMWLGGLLSVVLVAMTACQKESDDAHGDAQVVVTVYDAAGAVVSGETVKLYNETAYEAWRKNNLTAPTAAELTDAKGQAHFTLPEAIWFATGNTRQPMFVVQEGGGPDNFEIYSTGQTVRAGQKLRLTIRKTDR